MLDQFGALFLDDDRASLEVLVVGIVVLLERFQARERLDLGLGGIVNAAVEVAVGMGRSGVCEESMQHGPNLPFGCGPQPSAARLAAAPVCRRRGLDAARASTG